MNCVVLAAQVIPNSSHCPVCLTRPRGCLRSVSPVAERSLPAHTGDTLLHADTDRAARPAGAAGRVTDGADTDPGRGATARTRGAAAGLGADARATQLIRQAGQAQPRVSPAGRQLDARSAHPHCVQAPGARRRDARAGHAALVARAGPAVAKGDSTRRRQVARVTGAVRQATTARAHAGLATVGQARVDEGRRHARARAAHLARPTDLAPPTDATAGQPRDP
jgi:hypothetical protein